MNRNIVSRAKRMGGRHRMIGGVFYANGCNAGKILL